MKVFLFFIVFFFSTNILVSNDNQLSISNLEVMKRNKPSCDRLGNIYDACQWMVRFTINNKTNNNLLSFCSLIKINDNKYKLCGNKMSKKYHTGAKKKNVILTNLSKLIDYKNDDPKPTVRILTLRGNFSE